MAAAGVRMHLFSNDNRLASSPGERALVGYIGVLNDVDKFKVFVPQREDQEVVRRDYWLTVNPSK